jgi:hypothetical protein
MENTDILIQQYLDHTLPDEEQAAFVQRLRTDKELQAALALSRQGRAAFSTTSAGDETAFRELLREASGTYFEASSQAIEKINTPEAVRRRLPVRYRWAAAAAVLVLAFAGLKWYAARQYSLPALLAQHYAPSATPATLSDGQYALQEAYAAWRNRQWIEAAQRFGAVPPNDERYAEAQLFAGYAFYESEEYTSAVAAFDTVIKTGDIRFTSNAEWHRLLALLARNPQDEAARQALQDLSADAAHPYRQKALKLHRQLGHPLRALTR